MTDSNKNAAGYQAHLVWWGPDGLAAVALKDVFADHRIVARWEFFKALARLAPSEDMERLWRQRERVAAIQERERQGEPREQLEPEMATVIAEVKAWADGIRLSTPWVAMDAFACLLRPESCPDGVIRPRIDNPNSAARSVAIAPIALQIPTYVWDLEHVPRRDFEATLRDRFEEAMRVELNAAEARAEDGGLTTQQRTDYQRDAERVVRRLVLELSPKAILQAEGHPEPDAPNEAPDFERGVRKSINNMCALLELPSPDVGRPKQST